jgi:hypothetical protein
MFEIVNYIEAALWAAIGVFLLVHALRRKSGSGRAVVFAGLVFLSFGLSDVIEVRTGAWWRPWWLLAWKAVCMVSMIGLLLRYWRRKPAADNKQT